ncbi:Dnaj domain [Thalictrum thalictroides]|uniref:Dnaj domain n=1 Tax=Thalictrum thalictroides TaxID=46969 RepID=A0A7J6WV31_THATH|nr:Dnaj domain [Thalictrum thalictroides]
MGPRWDTGRSNTWNADESDSSHGSNKKSRSKKSRRLSQAGKGKPRRNFCDDFDEDSETFLQAKYGKKCYKWSFRPSDGPNFQSSSHEFAWRDQSNWTSNRRRVWDSTSEMKQRIHWRRLCWMDDSWLSRSVQILYMGSLELLPIALSRDLI